MAYLNYNNLDEETQEHLIAKSIKDIKQQFGDKLRIYAKQRHLNYDTLLHEEAIRNLYNYRYEFSI